jgi:hypothetical protein
MKKKSGPIKEILKEVKHEDKILQDIEKKISKKHSKKSKKHRKKSTSYTREMRLKNLRKAWRARGLTPHF